MLVFESCEANYQPVLLRVTNIAIGGKTLACGPGSNIVMVTVGHSTGSSGVATDDRKSGDSVVEDESRHRTRGGAKRTS